MKKAWRISLIGCCGITAATTRGQAIYFAVRLAKEIGYRCKFTDAVARRAPEYDDWAAGHTGYCSVYDEDIFKKGWRP